MTEKIAYIYIMTNKSFSGHDWVKIGYAKDVEKRRKQLSTTSLPYPYEVFATYEIPESEHLGDKVLHKLITNLNPSLRLTENREFFEMTPQQAYELLKNLAIIHDREDKLVLNGSMISDKKASKKTAANKKIEEKPEESFYHYFGDEKAEVTLAIDTFTLKAGSAVRINLKPNNPELARQQKDLEDGILVGNDNEIGHVNKDRVFSSSSSAAKYVAGSSQSGMIYWKTRDGVLLKDYLESKSE